jgi:hypothetical protein
MTDVDTTRICGYCHTDNHEKCRPVIKWYDKEWYCYCECQTKEGETNEYILPEL